MNALLAVKNLIKLNANESTYIYIYIFLKSQHSKPSEAIQYKKQIENKSLKLYLMLWFNSLIQ